MDSHNSAQWPLADPNSYDPLTSVTEDDFSNFLDLDNIDFDFPLNNGASYDTSGLPDGQPAPNTTSASCFNDFSQYETCPVTMSAGYHNDQTQDGAMAIDRRDYGNYDHQDLAQRWETQQQMYQHMSVPPTPNSSGMYPTSYVHQLQGYSQANGGRPTFEELTPLTTPQFVNSASSSAMPGYPMLESNLLSPLNSPALYAQNGSSRGSASVRSLTAESSATGSPIEVDTNCQDDDMTANERPRKTRRKESLSSLTKPPAASTRKRKAAPPVKSSSKIATRGNSFDDIANLVTLKPSASGLVTSQPSSSPQHNLAMRPPPKPASAKCTPTSTPQPNMNSSTGQPPATPASIMRITGKQQSNNGSLNALPSDLSVPSPSTDVLGLGMEELHLPEAAAEPPKVPSGSAASRVVPPTSAGARATPALLPRIHSSGPVGLTSPPVVAFTNTSKNPNGRGGSRKRNPVSSALASPALRPRISPNIRPMISGDGSQAIAAQNKISDETHALLLASKSNYQNLLEGNTLPGVTYPSELSHNLTSKRTSHKLAEQGRRNRINTALQEMQALLPASPALEAMSPTSGEPKERGSSGESGNEPSNGDKTPNLLPLTGANSKAATVELAIEHIKSLNAMLAEKDDENDRLRQELEEARKKLSAEVGPDTATQTRAGAAKAKGSSPRAREAALAATKK